MSSGIETVLSVLEEAAFERLPKPLVVAGSTFNFDAAAKGTGVSHDLVVAAEVPSDPRRLVRLVSGLSRVLDQVGSRRPISLVLLGNPLAATKTDLERNARVLTVESIDPEPDEVRQAVAVLLPLRLPSAASHGRDPLEEVQRTLGTPLSKEHQALIDAAKVGPDTVRDSLRRFIDSAVQDEPAEGVDP